MPWHREGVGVAPKNPDDGQLYVTLLETEMSSPDVRPTQMGHLSC